MAKKKKSENNDELNQEEVILEENSTVDNEETSAKEVAQEEESLNTKMLRLQADFLNYKARTDKEKTATYRNAVTDVITDVLPIIDNLERALSAENSDNEEVKNLKNGVKMIYDQLYNALQKRGLKEIEALDTKFDPNIHSGIAFEVTEDKEEDTVVEVFQKGYMVNEKVIRPSMVKIAKK